MRNFNIFKKVHHVWNHRHEPEFALFLADMLWNVILFVLFFSLIIFSSFSVWTLFIQSDVDLDIAVRKESTTLDKSKLDAVLDAFDQRTRHHELLKRNPPTFIDPGR